MEQDGSHRPQEIADFLQSIDTGHPRAGRSEIHEDSTGRACRTDRPTEQDIAPSENLARKEFPSGGLNRGSTRGSPSRRGTIPIQGEDVRRGGFPFRLKKESNLFKVSIFRSSDKFFYQITPRLFAASASDGFPRYSPARPSRSQNERSRATIEAGVFSSSRIPFATSHDAPFSTSAQTQP